MTPDDAALPLRKSLRGRGLFATLALLLYLLGCGLFIAHQRAGVVATVQAQAQLARHEKALALAESSLNSALVEVNEASNAELAQPGTPSDVRLYMESCVQLFATLDEFDPRYAALQKPIARSYDALLQSPARANWIDLRESMHRASVALEQRRRDLIEQRDGLARQYRTQSDGLTFDALLLAGAGLLLFGTAAALTFGRLARDVRRLEAHARQIVHGTRGAALPVTRDDELGQLMHAINRMAADLDARDRQIELDTQRRSHQDKMLAVGALAAGIAHELNNPLAVVSGTAQELLADESLPAAQRAQAVRLILAQTERASQAARQLADLAAPQPAELDWLDLNALLRRVAQLMGYDRRYRGIVFVLEIDRELPAVRTSANAIQQLLMQLLTLGCDAVALHPGGERTLRIVTAHVDGQVRVQLHVPPVVDFSRRDVQRILLLSRAIAEPLQGQLALGQVAGPALRIQLTLPTDGGGSQG